MSAGVTYTIIVVSGILILLLLLVCVYYGVKLGMDSLVQGRLPLLRERFITGFSAKIIGVICVIIGVLSLFILLMLFAS